MPQIAVALLLRICKGGGPRVVVPCCPINCSPLLHGRAAEPLLHDGKEPSPMLEIDIPGRGAFGFHHVVCDYNGTIATDGHLIEGVAGRIGEIAEHVQVSVLTADTFGTVRAQAFRLTCACLIAKTRVLAKRPSCANSARRAAYASATASTTSPCSKRLRFRSRL